MFQAAINDPETVKGCSVIIEQPYTWITCMIKKTGRRGRKLQCPVHVVWSKRDDLQALYGDVLAVWQPWAAHKVTGAGIESGHHMAEDAPDELAKELQAFFTNHSNVQPES